MQNSTKILIGLTALAALTTAAIVLWPKKDKEKKSNVGGPKPGGGHHPHPGGGGYRPRFGYGDIYGSSYVFPYTPLYGYDQCTYQDKNGAVIVAPCNSSMGWSRAW